MLGGSICPITQRYWGIPEATAPVPAQRSTRMASPAWHSLRAVPRVTFRMCPWQGQDHRRAARLGPAQWHLGPAQPWRCLLGAGKSCPNVAECSRNLQEPQPTPLHQAEPSASAPPGPREVTPCGQGQQGASEGRKSVLGSAGTMKPLGEAALQSSESRLREGKGPGKGLRGDFSVREQWKGGFVPCGVLNSHPRLRSPALPSPGGDKMKRSLWAVTWCQQEGDPPAWERSGARHRSPAWLTGTLQPPQHPAPGQEQQNPLGMSPL